MCMHMQHCPLLMVLYMCCPVCVSCARQVNGCTGEKAVAEAGRGAGVKATQLLRILRLVKLFKILRLLQLQKRFEELCDRAPILDSEPHPKPNPKPNHNHNPDTRQ